MSRPIPVDASKSVAKIDAYMASRTRHESVPSSAAELLGEYGAIPKPRPIVLRPIHEIVNDCREAEWLIDDVLEANVLAILAGPRGSLKSFIATHWVMTAACSGAPCVILSGEGSDLDRRAASWMNQHRESTDLSTVPLVALERPLNLNSVVELEALRCAIAALPASPRLLLIDTFSKFSAGIDENSNGEVAAYLSGLATLREEFRCTVLLVAHSGHGDAKRPRGANALMSNPDAEYIVERSGMTVTVSRERFKATPSLPPLAYEAKVIDLGRLDRRGRPVTSLALVEADAPPPAAKGRGKNQEKIVVALKEWVRAHPDAQHLTSMDMRGMCKAQGIDRKREREVVNAFVNSRVLTPSIGGWTFAAENL